MMNIGNRVRVKNDTFRSNIGETGMIIAIHEETPTQYPYEVKFDSRTSTRCYLAHELARI